MYYGHSINETFSVLPIDPATTAAPAAPVAP